MEREDLRFGDIVLYENGSITFVGRALALIEKSSAVNVLNYSAAAILDVVKRDADSPSKIFIDAWDEWMKESFGSLELDWGDTARQFRCADSLVLVPLIFVRPLFDKGDVRFFVERGACPRCGDAGEWRSLALVCKYHGIYI